jgi:prepilin-type N-terminal cleavage/methylation domain-containing protein
MGRIEKRGPAGPFFCFRAAGFTMPELIVVLVIMAVLSAVAISSMTGTFATTRSVYDQLLAQISYARWPIADLRA